MSQSKIRLESGSPERERSSPADPLIGIIDTLASGRAFREEEVGLVSVEVDALNPDGRIQRYRIGPSGDVSWYIPSSSSNQPGHTEAVAVALNSRPIVRRNNDRRGEEMSMARRNQRQDAAANRSNAVAPMAIRSPAEQGNHTRFRWTYMQMWNNVAYFTFSTSSRVAWSKTEGRFVLKSNFFQMIGFATQQAMCFIDMFGIRRSLLTYLKGPTSLFTFVQIANLIFLSLKKFCYCKLVTVGMKDLLNVHTSSIENADTFYSVKRRKRTTLMFVVGYATCMGVLVVSYFVTTAYFDLKDWDWGFAELLQTHSCYTRQVYAWMAKKDCPEDIFLKIGDVPGKEIALGIVGMATSLSKALLTANYSLCLFSSSMETFTASRSLANADHNHGEALDHFNLMEEKCDKMSNYIGLFLLVALLQTATLMPIVVEKVFHSRSVDALNYAFPVVLNFIAFILFCISALYISRLKKRCLEVRNENQLPHAHQPQRFQIFLHNIFSKSMGVGYPDLFVLDFAFLITYLSIIGTFIGIFYDSLKSK